MSVSQWRREAARWTIVVIAAGAGLSFATIVFGAVSHDPPAPSWHSRVLLPLVLVVVGGGIRTAVLPPLRVPRGAVIAVVTSIGTLAAALYFLIGLHREASCTQEGVPDVDDQHAAVKAHLADAQLNGWTAFDLNLITGEMSCDQIGGPDDPTITHRVAVLDIIDHRWPFASR